MSKPDPQPLKFNYHRQPSCQHCHHRSSRGGGEGLCFCGHPEQQREPSRVGDSRWVNWDGICDLHEPREATP